VKTDDAIGREWWARHSMPESQCWDFLYPHLKIEYTLLAKLELAEGYIEALESAMKVANQALLETRHAQSVGDSWYTKGASGLYQQVDMWVRKGLAAIAATKSAFDAFGPPRPARPVDAPPP
jgi:hypothetical protein